MNLPQGLCICSSIVLKIFPPKIFSRWGPFHFLDLLSIITELLDSYNVPGSVFSASGQQLTGPDPALKEIRTLWSTQEVNLQAQFTVICAVGAEKTEETRQGVGVAELRLAGSGKQIPKEVISKLKDEQEKAREVVNKLSQPQGPRERVSHSGTVSTLLETLEPSGFTQNSAYTGRGVLSHLI